MNTIYKQSIYLLIITCLYLFSACSDEMTEGKDPSGQGVLFAPAVSMGVKTRVSELPNSDAMNEDKNGLQHIGLYIYYADDYAAGDLTKPYIRNLECKVDGGKLMPITGEKIYIYDRMTVVAFYPYNSTVSNFKVKADEEEYPITRNDYGNQTYIPYRAQLNTDPTIAYLAQLHFGPKHTAKIEVVLIGEDNFTITDAKILPHIDPPKEKDVPVDPNKPDNRAQYIDGAKAYANTPAGTGSFARQYTAYIWTSKEGDKHHSDNDTPAGTSANKHWDNIIHAGDTVFQSNEVTLISSRTVNLLNERQVYRYGYNLKTGEVFIPTSSRLVNCADSLQKVNCNENSAYQVCDIDLSGMTAWEPISITNGSYDGGGRKIKGLEIGDASLLTSNYIGLFGKIQGNSYIRNVNLINPVISVSRRGDLKDTCFIAPLCAGANPMLSQADLDALKHNLPPGLSQVVIDALIGDLKKLKSSTSHILACRVENPQVTATGPNLRVGTICATAGDKDEEQDCRIRIWDSYSTGGSINLNDSKNSGPNSLNTTAYAAGFCGLFKNGLIKHSYSTTLATAEAIVKDVEVEKASGFAHKADDAVGEGVVECYTWQSCENAKTFSSSNWPAESVWVKYTGKWPVYTNDWAETSNGANGHPAVRSFWQKVGSASTTYPVLLWEERQ